MPANVGEMHPACPSSKSKILLSNDITLTQGPGVVELCAAPQKVTAKLTADFQLLKQIIALEKPQCSCIHCILIEIDCKHHEYA